MVVRFADPADSVMVRKIGTASAAKDTPGKSETRGET